MSKYYRYDPGEPYEPPPRRRRRRPDYKRGGEYDDAWAAADEVGDDYGDVDAGGLAAGYAWGDDRQYGVYERGERFEGEWRDTYHDRPVPLRGQEQHPNVRPHQPPARLGPLPDSVNRVRDRRPHEPRHMHVSDERRSRSYHRDRARRGEYAEYYDPNTTPPPGARQSMYATSHTQPDRRGGPSTGRGIPYWQILMVVILSVFALLATALACASVLTLG
jgi:hypothetical protein